jgi:hypothetical protein
MQMIRLANAPPSIEALPSRQRDVPLTLALDIVTRLLLAPDVTRRGRASRKPRHRTDESASSPPQRLVARLHDPGRLLVPGSLCHAMSRPGTLVRITFAIAQRPR